MNESSVHESVNNSKSWFRRTWLIHGREALQLLAVYVVFTAVWFTIGWSLKHPFADSGVVRADRRISEWFVPRRTPTLNSMTYVGSMMSDTVVKIVITAVVALVMLFVWKRWFEALVVGVPLALEALCFITTTTLVKRPRPDVPRLEGSPIGSSYPSGHMAAAVAYSAIVVVIFLHTRRRWIRVLAVVVGTLVPLCVGTSRIYRGMHFFTDVIFGALLGGACVIATTLILTRAAERRGEAKPHGGQEHRDDEHDGRPATELVAP